eukprot:622834-Prorocentrum_minimum.AAC.1
MANLEGRPGVSRISGFAGGGRGRAATPPAGPGLQIGPPRPLGRGGGGGGGGGARGPAGGRGGGCGGGADGAAGAVQPKRVARANGAAAAGRRNERSSAC